MSKKMCFLFLAGAIVFEVIGTSVMKISQNNWFILGLFIMYTMLGFSYYFLSKSLIKIPVGVAYAAWEAFGTLGILFVSVFLLNEPLNLLHYTAIALLLVGTALINHGTE